MSDVKNRAAAPVFYLKDEGHADSGGSIQLGIWIFILSDCLIFAGLFAAYAALGQHYAGGATPAKMFHMAPVAFNTAVMLLSSFTCGLALLATGEGRNGAAQGWLAATGLLGLCFVGAQISEAHHLANEGITAQGSAFLGSYFSLIQTHSLHVIAGVLWILTLIAQITIKGLGAVNRNRVLCFAVFWNFLDIIWVCMFIFVYMIGMLK